MALLIPLHGAISSTSYCYSFFFLIFMLTTLFLSGLFENSAEISVFLSWNHNLSMNIFFIMPKEADGYLCFLSTRSMLDRTCNPSRVSSAWLPAQSSLSGLSLGATKAAFLKVRAAAHTAVTIFSTILKLENPEGWMVELSCVIDKYWQYACKYV